MLQFYRLWPFFLLEYVIHFAHSANWAQLAGERNQTIVTPYTPQQWYKDAESIERSMWSARWGHAVTVIDQISAYRNDLSLEENSERAETLVPKLIVLGGDDYGFSEEDVMNPIGGLRNDVWVSEMSSRIASTWKRNNRFQVQSPLDGIQPESVQSQTSWYQSNPGHEAPPVWPLGSDKSGQLMTFDDWIACQEYFVDKKEAHAFSCKNLIPSCGYFSSGECMDKDTIKEKNMWSPRRGHGAVVANGELLVIGGRSKEQANINDSRLVGGIEEPRILSSKDHQTMRQRNVLKNDIWVSRDGEGKSWSLVTPGCRDQQEDILSFTEVWSSRESNFAGFSSSRCSTSSDCYGDAICKIIKEGSNAVCVCPMFSVREHHSVSVQHRYHTREDNSVFSEDYIYVVGGFTHIRQDFCGNQACSSRASYRMALDDAWVSNDSKTWLQLRAATSTGMDAYKSRGGHSSILVHANHFRTKTLDDTLWIIGGESVGPETNASQYLKDIWSVSLSHEPCCISIDHCVSSPHPLLLENLGKCLPKASDWERVVNVDKWDGRSGHAVIYEPPSSLNEFIDHIYLIGGRNNSNVFSDVWSFEPLSDNITWHKDFGSHPLRNRVLGRGMSTDEEEHEFNLYQWHYDMDSELSELTRLQLPITNNMKQEEFSTPLAIPILDQKSLEALGNLGIRTMMDMANADQYTMLQLRGFDFPGRDTNILPEACYLKELAQSFNEKCYSIYDGKRHKSVLDTCKQHHDIDCISKVWDGCEALDFISYIDIHGIGIVTVPSDVYDTSDDLENMFCRQTPGPRYMAAGQFIDGKALILGGRGDHPGHLYRDVWSRDSTIPRASMKIKPNTKSSQSVFVFECDEDGAMQFEYKIFDINERLDVTPWLPAMKDENVDISWLDTKKGGPGSGWYTMYVRGVDTSGNRDLKYSTSTNAYTWFYLQPLPWGKISLTICAVIILSVGGFIEYRRRERKAALERYAQRRMRRKFKLHAMTGGEGVDDWKEVYNKQAMNSVRASRQTMDRNLPVDHHSSSGQQHYKDRKSRRRNGERYRPYQVQESNDAEFEGTRSTSSGYPPSRRKHHPKLN